MRSAESIMRGIEQSNMVEVEVNGVKKTMTTRQYKAWVRKMRKEREATKNI